MKLLPDSRTVVLITRTGDLLTVSLEDTDPQVCNVWAGLNFSLIFSQFEVVGSVEAGINAASWSPDDSLLVLATGWYSPYC